MNFFDFYKQMILESNYTLSQKYSNGLIGLFLGKWIYRCKEDNIKVEILDDEDGRMNATLILDYDTDTIFISKNEILKNENDLVSVNNVILHEVLHIHTKYIITEMREVLKNKNFGKIRNDIEYLFGVDPDLISNRDISYFYGAYSEVVFEVVADKYALDSGWFQELYKPFFEKFSSKKILRNYYLLGQSYKKEAEYALIVRNRKKAIKLFNISPEFIVDIIIDFYKMGSYIL